MNHAVSTCILAAALLMAVGAAAGYYFGVRHAPTYHDALVIEKRLREVFCEQAVKNGLMKTCEVFERG